MSLQSTIEGLLRRAVTDHKTAATAASTQAASPTSPSTSSLSAEEFVEAVRLAVGTVLIDTFRCMLL
jgi:hypothetical protein